MVSESRVHLKAGEADPQKRRHDLTHLAPLYSVQLQHLGIVSNSLQKILTVAVMSIPGFMQRETFQQSKKKKGKKKDFF